MAASTPLLRLSDTHCAHHSSRSTTACEIQIHIQTACRPPAPGSQHNSLVYGLKQACVTTSYELLDVHKTHAEMIAG